MPATEIIQNLFFLINHIPPASKWDLKQSVQKNLPEQGFLTGHQSLKSCIKLCLHVQMCFSWRESLDFFRLSRGIWFPQIKVCRKSLVLLVVFFQRPYNCCWFWVKTFLSLFVFSALLMHFMSLYPIKSRIPLVFPVAQGKMERPQSGI